MFREEALGVDIFCEGGVGFFLRQCRCLCAGDKDCIKYSDLVIIMHGNCTDFSARDTLVVFKENILVD